MHIRVLSMERSTARWAQFQKHNPHLEAERFLAIDGSTVDRAILREQGTIADNLQYNTGALGNALSHIAQWKQAVASETTLTVLEDDAVVCANFIQESSRVIASLPPDWDYIQWGFNFDTCLTFDLMPGFSPCFAAFAFDQDAMRLKLADFHRHRITTSAFPLKVSLGIPGYTVSPRGARRLLKFCLPLRQTTAYIRSSTKHTAIGVSIS